MIEVTGVLKDRGEIVALGYVIRVEGAVRFLVDFAESANKSWVKNREPSLMSCGGFACGR